MKPKNRLEDPCEEVAISVEIGRMRRDIWRVFHAGEKRVEHLTRGRAWEVQGSGRGSGCSLRGGWKAA